MMLGSDQFMILKHLYFNRTTERYGESSLPKQEKILKPKSAGQKVMWIMLAICSLFLTLVIFGFGIFVFLNFETHNQVPLSNPAELSPQPSNHVKENNAISIESNSQSQSALEAEKTAKDEEDRLLQEEAIRKEKELLDKIDSLKNDLAGVADALN